MRPDPTVLLHKVWAEYAFQAVFHLIKQWTLVFLAPNYSNYWHYYSNYWAWASNWAAFCPHRPPSPPPWIGIALASISSTIYPFFTAHGVFTEKFNLFWKLWLSAFFILKVLSFFTQLLLDACFTGRAEKRRARTWEKARPQNSRPAGKHWKLAGLAD